MGALFDENASATLGKVSEIFGERGRQYGDTWRHNQWLAFRAVYRELTGEELNPDLCIALAAAVMVDVKYQRFEGGWNDDHAIDGIAYQAFLAKAVHNAKENR